MVMTEASRLNFEWQVDALMGYGTVKFVSCNRLGLKRVCALAVLSYCNVKSG